MNSNVSQIWFLSDSLKHSKCIVVKLFWDKYNKCAMRYTHFAKLWIKQFSRSEYIRDIRDIRSSKRSKSNTKIQSLNMFKSDNLDIRKVRFRSNIKNIWFEHIQTLNFSIWFASLQTSKISNISNIFRAWKLLDSKFCKVCISHSTFIVFVPK